MTQPAQKMATLTALQSRIQWVCWRKEKRKSNWTKIPYNPRTGKPAASNDPDTWSPYTVALAAWQKQSNRYDGLGYMFNRDVTGIDLDHCVDAQGHIEPWAWSLIERLASYTEYSPSGDGVHIWARGIIPKGMRRATPRTWKAQQNDAAIEMYCEGRYFTVTGDHVEGTPTTIEDRQDALNALYHEVIGPASQPLGSNGVPKDNPLQSSLNDDQVLKKAEAASNGGKFRSLFYDGAAGYPSASEADFALCLILAFWTRRNTVQMDRLFRRSALYREKWDSARSASTYGQDTIQKAATRCDVIYDPKQSQSKQQQDMDHLFGQIATQQDKGKTGQKSKPYQLKPKEVEVSKILAYLDENEYGDACFFAEAFAGQVCYDHDDKKWYLWQGHHWKKDANWQMRKLVAGGLGMLYLQAAANLKATQADKELQIQTLERETTQEGDASLRLPTLQGEAKRLTAQIERLHSRVSGLRTAKRTNSVLTFIQSEMGTNADRWDTDPWLLAVQNGVIDLRTGEHRDGNPEDYIRTVAPTDWTGPDTPCPRFERFLEEIFEDKPDLESFIAFMQRVLGYGITGFATEHIFLLFHGKDGRNGKDTLLATLQGILGPYVGVVSNDVFLDQDKSRSAGAATPHLCDLQGKRLAWGSETGVRDRLNIPQLKKLTGGGDIPARKNYGDPYAFAPTHTLILLTNYKPQANAGDRAFWERARLIEFGISFVEHPQKSHERIPDKNLKETLKQERSGILAWLLRGCLAWQSQGLNTPVSVQLATNAYREGEDKLLLFTQECCIEAEEAYVQAATLFAAYCDWYKFKRFDDQCMNGTVFGEEMAKRFSKKRTKIGIIYQGIGLLTREPNQEIFFSDSDEGEGLVKGTIHSQKGDESRPEATSLDIQKNEGVGLVKGISSPQKGSKPRSEATSLDIQETEGVGYVGLHQKLSQGEKTRQYNPIGIGIEKVSGHTLHPLHPSSSVNTSHDRIEANAAPIEVPFTDPTPSISVNSNEASSEANAAPIGAERISLTPPTLSIHNHPCTTRWEEREKTPHQANATDLIAGSWWCERCAPQRELMELGERIDYPKIDLSSCGFIVSPGHKKWLKFAKAAGYKLVTQAIEKATPLDEQETPSDRASDTFHL